MRHAAAFVIVLASVDSFASEPQAEPKPPGLRLGDAARPTRYSARLRVVPTEPTFTGSIDIDLTLSKPSLVVWLNGSDLKIGAARFEVCGKDVAARPVAGGERYIGFAAD